jgi:hypothetical protein
MTRLLALALAIAALLAIGAAPAGAHARTTPEGVPIPELDWRDCDGGYECATAEVPRDYSRPRAPKIRLAVVRHEALDPAHRIGSIFMNPGGPGSSAVRMVRELPPPVFQLSPSSTSTDFDELGARLDAAPIDLGDGRRLDGQRVTRIVFELLYNRIDWPVVAELLRAARDGDVATLREMPGPSASCATSATPAW